METVMVPERGSPPLGPAVYATGPLPVPLAVTPVTHGAGVVAVHAHPVAVVTLKEADAPPAATEAPEALSARVHPFDWLTVKVWPPAVSVPLRATPVFAATE